NVTGAQITVTYVVTPTSGAACAGVPQNVDIKVNPIPVITAGQTKTICSGDNVGYEILLTPANLPAGTVFNWPDPDGVGPATAGVNVPMGVAGTIHINDVLTNVTGAQTTMTYVVTPSVGICAGSPQNVDIKVNPAPALVVGQTKTICSGNNVAYEILLNPANLPVGTVFNWPDPDGVGPATAGVNVPMGVAGTIHINDVLTNVTGAQITVTYVVTPTSGAGCAGTPQNVDIKVDQIPVITAGQTKTICSGDNVNYEILLTPANIPAGTVFNWPDPDGVGPATAGVNVAMGPAGTIHINDVLTNVTGAQITVTYVVTPSEGVCTGTPENVDIKVDPAPVLVAGQTKTICSGDNVGYEILLTPANLPAGTVFNWPDPDGAGPATAGVNVAMGAAGTIHINDVLTNVTGAQITVTYVVTPTSGAACAGAPKNVDIKVNPAPVLVLGQTKTICSGDNVGYEILLTPANLPVGTVFNWPDPDGAGPATAGVNVAMGVAGTIHINDVLTNVTGAQITVTYVVTPSAGICAGVPQNVDIKVNPAPVITAGQTKTICSGDNVGYEILLTPVNLPAGTEFNWPDPDGVGPATAGVNVAMGVAGTVHINDVLTNVTGAQITVTYVVTPSAGICAGVPQNVDIKVNPAPAITAGQTKTICSGDNVGYEILLTPANLPAGTVFNWPDPDGAGPATAGVNVAMGAAGTIHINDVLTNVTGAQITVTYVVTPTSGAACAGAPQNIAIKVNPAPVLVAGQTKTICSGSNVGYEILLTPANLPAGTVFNWPDPDGAGPATAGVNVAMGAAGTIHINDVLTNGTAVPVTVTYVVTPSSGACTGTTQNVDIVIDQGSTANAGVDQSICTGSTYTLVGSSVGGAATTGAWSIASQPVGGDGLLSTTVQVGNPASVTFTATVVGNYKLTLTTNDPPGVCAAVSDDVTITVTAIPVLVALQAKTICGNQSVAYEILLNPANQPANTVFNWPDPDGAGPATAGVNVSMGVAGTKHINDILTNTTSAAITVTYQVTPSVGSCVGNPQNIDITVNPSPVVQTLQTKTICSGELTGYEILLSPANQPAGVTFSWPDPDGTGSATSRVNVPEGAAGTIHINDQLFNGTASAILVQYSIIPKSNLGCFGITQTVDIIVNPGAVVNAGSSQLICSGGTIPLSGASIGGLATTGTWSIVSSPAGGDGLLSLTTPTATPSNVTFKATVAGDYVLRLTTDDPAGSCPSISDDATITVRSLNDPLCTGGPGGGGGNVNCGKFNINITEVRPSCSSQNNGQISITVTGGAPSPNYTLTLYDSMRAPLPPFTKGVTVAPSTTYTFNSLSPSLTYFYKVDDGTTTCTLPYSLPIQTTVSATASGFVDAQCYNQAVGQATVTVTSGGASPYEYSLDAGTTWVSFTSPVTITNLMPAALPYSILVRDDATDQCPAQVSVTIGNAVTDIQITSTVTDATCANNDGSVQITSVSGGSGSYTYQFDGQSQAGLSYNNLSGGNHTFVITDTNGCSKTFPFTVNFPGLVNFTTQVNNPDCSGGGNNGSIVATISSSGTFDFGITTDPVNDPASFQAVTSAGNSTVTFTSLTRGVYYVVAKPSGALCPSRHPADSIKGGPYGVDFSFISNNFVCYDTKGTVKLFPIQGSPSVNYNYEIFSSGSVVQSGVITQTQKLDTVRLTGLENGNYQIHLFQYQPACPDSIFSPAKSFTIMGPKTPSFDTLAVTRLASEYNMATGSMKIDIQNILEPTYRIKLQLVAPDISGQTNKHNGFDSLWVVADARVNQIIEFNATELYGGLYRLHVRDTLGCVKIYDLTIPLDTEVFIPNIFTPNNDGKNDNFEILYLPDNSHIIITNRWGKQVLNSSAFTRSPDGITSIVWNGGAEVDGVYYYTLNTPSKTYTGWVEVKH
ncbi:MAG: gliding motility-associated C-terminal domain-containing protein, partial [Bacteroidetes bacterium]|nr:gliding motility-associated C-terminal domain-containing protein [Bacteroidota bacterium]